MTTPVPAIPEPANGNYPAGWDTETQGRWLPPHGWTPGSREAEDDEAEPQVLWEESGTEPQD